VKESIMDLIELHIVQSFPVTCLNRDDLGAPKTAVYGGVQRARVSSQSWKRAIRESAASMRGDLFAGKRGHYQAEPLMHAIMRRGVPEDKAREAAGSIATFLGKQDEKVKDGHKTSVALYFSPLELDAIAEQAARDLTEKGAADPKKGGLKKALGKLPPRDAADIAIFGRMVADDHSLMLEGAGLFSHALSTHKASNEIDFFSAVDDLKPEESEGAGHIGTLEFNSACYYRYVGLNFDLLRDADHLGHLTGDERRQVLDAFLRSAVLAVPKARKNSMFGFNPPSFVLGLRRRGQPLSLVNAFEKPVRASSTGFIEPSIEALKSHHEALCATYDLEPGVELCIPDVNLGPFVEQLIAGSPVKDA
jgi:CRISPR system Cascade subunit CasC